MNVCNWLLSLSGENLAVASVVGALWSFIVEMFPRFAELSYVTKRWIMLALCLGVPVVALLVAVYGLACADAVLSVDTLATAIAAGCAAFAASQIAHLRKS